MHLIGNIRLHVFLPNTASSKEAIQIAQFFIVGEGRMSDTFSGDIGPPKSSQNVGSCKDLCTYMHNDMEETQK